MKNFNVNSSAYIDNKFTVSPKKLQFCTHIHTKRFTKWYFFSLALQETWSLSCKLYGLPSVCFFSSLFSYALLLDHVYKSQDTSAVKYWLRFTVEILILYHGGEISVLESIPFSFISIYICCHAKNVGPNKYLKWLLLYLQKLCSAVSNTIKVRYDEIDLEVEG